MSTSSGKKSSSLSRRGNLSTYPCRAVTTMSPEAVTLASAVFFLESRALVPFLRILDALWNAFSMSSSDVSTVGILKSIPAMSGPIPSLFIIMR